MNARAQQASKLSENAEPLTGIEPITFSLPVRRSNH